MNKGPIFITGLPRSGTTLLGNIIDRHPRIAVFVESFFIPQYYFLQCFYWPLSNKANYLRMAKAIVKEEASKRNHLELDEDAVLAVTRRNYSHLLDALMRSWARTQGKERWADKSPGYITKLRLLHRMYPNAQFVHIIRDGRDVWLSLRKLGWEKNIVAVARVWEKSIRNARQFARNHLGNNYLELRYEDLIRNPQVELKKIMEFLGEPYTDELINENSSSGRNRAFMGWPDIHETISSDNSQKWMKELSPEDVALFESQAGHLLRDLGYPLVHDKSMSRRYWKLGKLLLASYIARGYRLVKTWSALLLRHGHQSIR